ncbi:MAG: hypothetical protein ACOCQR_02335 [bacterium]
MVKINSKFDLGRVVITRGAEAELSEEDVDSGIRRHAMGDWGDVVEDDAKMNDEALKHEGRIMSVYHSEDGVKFWIITEWDRSATTILLPSEY